MNQKFLDLVFSTLIILFIFLTSNRFLYANEIKKPALQVNKDTDKKNQSEHIKIYLVPRIKMIEINSLKSYMWWEKENPKIPNVYKSILGKIKDDFNIGGIAVEYDYTKTNKESEIKKNQYILYGNLILDSKNKKNYKLKELAIYKFDNNTPDIVLISNHEIYDVNSNYKNIAYEFKSKISDPKPADWTVQKTSIDQQPKEVCFLIFENDLSFDELNKIRNEIKEYLNISLNSVQILYSEHRKYTFQINSNSSVFERIKNANFINGPYKNEINGNTMIMKSYTDEDFL